MYRFFIKLSLFVDYSFMAIRYLDMFLKIIKYITQNFKNSAFIKEKLTCRKYFSNLLFKTFTNYRTKKEKKKRYRKIKKTMKIK